MPQDPELIRRYHDPCYWGKRLSPVRAEQLLNALHRLTPLLRQLYDVERECVCPVVWLLHPHLEAEAPYYMLSAHVAYPKNEETLRDARAQSQLELDPDLVRRALTYIFVPAPWCHRPAHSDQPWRWGGLIDRALHPPVSFVPERAVMKISVPESLVKTYLAADVVAQQQQRDDEFVQSLPKSLGCTVFDTLPHDTPAGRPTGFEVQPNAPRD